MTELDIKMAKLNGIEEIVMGEEIDRRARIKYSLSEELSIQRQRNEKPEEFQRYYDYMEQCKAEVKAEFAAVDVSEVGMYG